MPSPHATYGVGSRVGPYAIESRLGRGGMGAVYRARHVETGTIHALKVILSAAPSDRSLARFRREAELLARIDAHPNVVRIHATGLEQGAPWCAMAHVHRHDVLHRDLEPEGLHEASADHHLQHDRVEEALADLHQRLGRDERAAADRAAASLAAEAKR